MTTQQSIDQAKTEAFVGKVLADTAGLAVTVISSIGDRLGLFKQLAQAPATSEELAEHAHVNERYAREWLSAMASAGYLEYDSASSPLHPPTRARSCACPGRWPCLLRWGARGNRRVSRPVNQLMQAFRTGGGVPMEAYDPSAWEGMHALPVACLRICWCPCGCQPCQRCRRNWNAVPWLPMSAVGKERR